MESIREERRDDWNKASLQAPPFNVLLIDGDDLSIRKNRTKLGQSGYRDVESHRSLPTARRRLDEYTPDLIFLEIVSGVDEEAGFELMSWLRDHKFKGIVVVISSRPTIPVIYRAAMLGAAEFLVKGHSLNLGEETNRLRQRRKHNDGSIWQSKAFLNSGLFTSMGLTKAEITILSEFANGFPKHQEIADRLRKKNPYIRKTFSRIYEKVGSYLPVENSAQLSHLVTVCSLFR